MAMVYDEKNNILRFDVPNSEAVINAQHLGIVDRTVGSYYMSDNVDKCKEFLNNFDGEYYIDIVLTIQNSNKILSLLKDKGYCNAFKKMLVPQEKNIKALDWMVSSGEAYHRMRSPTINANEKYLKLDNEDSCVDAFRTLVLGDLCSIYIKRIGINGYLFYVDKNPMFDEIIKKNKVLKWIR